MVDGEVSFTGVTLELEDGRQILRGITLVIERLTTVALLGRSGSGKTTLLRTVNGLATPTSGAISVRGQALSTYDLTTLRRSIGYVIQETGLFPHMTIARNVALSYELSGRDAADTSARSAAVLGMTGLSAAEFSARYPHQLSGGQRQRVGLARALMNDPSILLMDEPFGALDPITRSEIQTMLHELLRTVRKTVLIVTHDLEEALYLADRVVFLEAGAVVADLPSAAVRHSDNPAVQQYLQAIRREAVPAEPPV